jgi:hypothetical protein
MKNDRPPEGPADEEELRSAAALARALEGGADHPDVPQAALEAAALLRLSAGVAELGGERRDAIKRELLAGLPAHSERRRRSLLLGWARALPRWSYFALPLASAAVVGSLLLVKNPEPEASFAERSSAERVAASGASRAGEETEGEEAAADPMRPADEALSRAEAAQRSAASQRSAAAKAESGPEPAPWLGMPSSPSDSAARGEAEAPGALALGEEAGGIGASASGSAPARRQAMLADEQRGGATAGSPVGNLRGAARQPSARAALVGLEKDVRAERAQLLARSHDAELSRAHAELDGARSQVELERSRASLIRLLDTAGEGLDADDARHLRQDLYCRLAETALRLGEPRSALEWTRRGIDLDGPPSPFLAQLMALEGDALAALGEPSSAAASYMKALRVHEALLDESLDGR